MRIIDYVTPGLYVLGKIVCHFQETILIPYMVMNVAEGTVEFGKCFLAGIRHNERIFIEIYKMKEISLRQRPFIVQYEVFQSRELPVLIKSQVTMRHQKHQFATGL